MSGASPDRMSDVFNTLPGIEASVSSVSKSLRDMWADVAASGKTALPPDEVKATQLNLVLHLGLPTIPDDAIGQFQVALKFAQRYPCRVVVLCPLPEDSQQREIRAKVYGECFFGKSKGDTRCVEAVMLSYPVSARAYLENQVSVCLSTDLPLYYWVHRFSDAGKLSAYQYLLRRSKRVIFDTAIVPLDALAYSWPRPEAVRDLAYSRLLHVRQVVGQFLSGTSPAVLARGLRSITLSHTPAYRAEAFSLGRWLADRLADCGANAGETSPKLRITPSAGADSLSVSFAYDDARRFAWRGNFSTHQGSFEANFGGETVHLPSTVSLLAPEMALSEAMFF